MFKTLNNLPICLSSYQPHSNELRRWDHPQHVNRWGLHSPPNHRTCVPGCPEPDRLPHKGPDILRAAVASPLKLGRKSYVASRRSCAMLPWILREKWPLIYPSSPWKRAKHCWKARSSLLLTSSSTAPGALLPGYRTLQHPGNYTQFHHDVWYQHPQRTLCQHSANLWPLCTQAPVTECRR